MNKFNIDCLLFIFNQVNKKTLYSCLLVDKEWCNIVVPILWKKVLMYYESVKLFNTILSCLPFPSKQLLSNNGIKLSSEILLRSPLFDYISFCEFPIAQFTINIGIKIVEFDRKKHEGCNLFKQ